MKNLFEINKEIMETEESISCLDKKLKEHRKHLKYLRSIWVKSVLDDQLDMFDGGEGE